MTDDDDDLEPLTPGISDYGLDLRIAVASAHRDVAAVWKRYAEADIWQRVLEALVTARGVRCRLYEAVDEAANPVTSRPMTAEELADDGD